MVAWIDEVNEAVLNIPKPSFSPACTNYEYYNPNTTKIGGNLSSSRIDDLNQKVTNNQNYALAQNQLERSANKTSRQKYFFGRKVEKPQDNQLQIVQLMQSPRPGRKINNRRHISIDSLLETKHSNYFENNSVTPVFDNFVLILVYSIAT